MDLPTTPEDVAALRRAGEPRPMDLSRYLRALSRLKLPRERRRKTHEGFEPFTLT